MGAEGWIGVDLDGTLAFYNGWQGANHIGAPIPRMVERVKRWVADGKEVRIVTARVGPGNGPECRGLVETWMQHNLGFVLPVTHEKDFRMTELWDDRAVQIIPNTGERADGRPD